MLSMTFDVRTHEEFGGLGLRMQGKPHFDPLQGMGIAHDMLEHFADDDGTLAGELQALGASLYVRDGEGYYGYKGSMRTDPSEHISAEFLQQVYYTRERGETHLPRPPKHRPCEEHVENWILNIVRKARTQLIEELGPDELPEWITSTEQRHYFRGWLRHGYCRAVKRYRRHSKHDMLCVFMEIENAVDKYLKYAEDFGQSVRIAVSLHARRVVLTEIREDW